MEKHESELDLPNEMNSFPGDPNLDVCPTAAVRWDSAGEFTFIDTDACIGCGLCVSRCPYGAISLLDGSVASVESSDPDGLVTCEPVQNEHSRPTRVGVISFLGVPAAMQLPGQVLKLGDVKTNLFIRNLLHEVGLNARSRRKGDTNIRMDAFGYSRSGRPFVGEFEVGAGLLESPRALLEDVAILHSRYGYEVASIDPVSVILAFPSLRSEYYQVLRDIDKVLGLRCRTITIGALLALLWNCKQVDGFIGDDFVVGEESIDLGPFLEGKIGSLIEPYPGALTPAK